MGANSFATYEKGSSLDQAFAAATERAAFEAGRGGYTGTVAEKSSVLAAWDKPISLAAARYLADQLTDDPRFSDKWGPAGAVAVTECPQASSTFTVTVPLGSDETPVYDLAGDPRVISQIKSSSSFNQGDIISKVALLDDQRQWIIEETTASDGDRQVWFLAKTNKLGYQSSNIEGDYFDDFESARLAARAAAEEEHICAEVKSKIINSDQSVLYQAKAQTGDRQVTFEITSESAVAKQADGWLIFGWASS